MSTWEAVLPNRLTALSFSSVVASRLSSPLSGPPTSIIPLSPPHGPLLCLTRRCPGVSMIGLRVGLTGAWCRLPATRKCPAYEPQMLVCRCVEAMRNNGPRNTRRDATNASVPTGCAPYTRALPPPAEAARTIDSDAAASESPPAACEVVRWSRSPAGPLRAGDRTITTAAPEPRSVETPQHVVFQFD